MVHKNAVYIIKYQCKGWFSFFFFLWFNKFEHLMIISHKSHLNDSEFGQQHNVIKTTQVSAEESEFILVTPMHSL